MSGRAEVAQLLQKLSDNTIGIAQASSAARGILSKHAAGTAGGGSPGSGSGGGNAGGGMRARPTEPSAVNRDLSDFRHELDKAQRDRLISAESAKAAYESRVRDTDELEQEAFLGGAAPVHQFEEV